MTASSFTAPPTDDFALISSGTRRHIQTPEFQTTGRDTVSVGQVQDKLVDAVYRPWEAGTITGSPRPDLGVLSLDLQTARGQPIPTHAPDGLPIARRKWVDDNESPLRELPMLPDFTVPSGALTDRPIRRPEKFPTHTVGMGVVDRFYDPHFQVIDRKSRTTDFDFHTSDTSVIPGFAPPRGAQTGRTGQGFGGGGSFADLPYYDVKLTQTKPKIHVAVISPLSHADQR
jgi:hypothetical protein